MLIVVLSLVFNYWLGERCGHAPNDRGSNPLLDGCLFLLMKNHLVPPRFDLVFFDLTTVANCGVSSMRILIYAISSP
jgi:hypothetical protein